ncbi:hypothetical protein VFPPC_18590 [Pochonia chlamydosporia 170]|uniref:Thioester reductase (TE) domain-containing protein n=1 Tax=Pochonia chlamydosporia 170 TaxID=1380566 RepID=A0A219ANU1_METCM|nr:hypothetical protein VFPPC_18590 [Pochonia chlamydosporia 170]OWT42507.1 hypothetical protein VFPPC_18590 [Pochonia chlamydosporia 170]
MADQDDNQSFHNSPQEPVIVPPGFERYRQWLSPNWRQHAQHGLPVYIHRPSSIIRPEQDIAGDNPTADVVQNMLDYSQRICAVPAAVLQLPGTVDLVYPETVSTKIIQAALRCGPEAENGHVTYIHESGDIELRLADICGHVASATGEDVEELSLEEWILRAQEVGLSDSMAAVFRGIGSAETLNFPKLLRD